MGTETIKIILLSTLTSMNSLNQAVSEINTEYGDVIWLKNYYLHLIEEQKIDEEKLLTDLKEADIILLDIRGQSHRHKKIIEIIAKSTNTVINLCGGSKEILSLTRMGSFHAKKIFQKQKDIGFDEDSVDIATGLKVMEWIKKAGRIFPFGIIRHAKNWGLAIDYWQYGGTENLKNFLRLLLKEYGKKKWVRFHPPVCFPKGGIYHPESKEFYLILDDFFKDFPPMPHKPNIGIFFYGGMHFDDCIPAVKALIEELKQDANIIPVFSDITVNIDNLERFFIKDGKSIVTAVINLQYFRLNGGPLGGDPKATITLQKKLNCPFFGPVHMYQSEIARWQESDIGLTPIETVIAVAMREIDGCIEPMILSGMSGTSFSKNIDDKVMDARVIDDRIKKFSNRFKRWLILQQKDNREKKIAIIIYDYPPGEENLGNTESLDVFQSINEILAQLKAHQYNLEIPKKDIKDLLLSSYMVNAPEWSLPDDYKGITVSKSLYSKWLDSVPSDLRDSMIKKWGTPPGNIMTWNDQFFIPGIMLGNIFIGIQPSRGLHEDQGASCHDRELPVHHQYLAFYKWIEHEFCADALIHLGTHGTLEFTHGKEVGLSSSCTPDILIGDMPHFYIYWVTNTSEATIAKRRSYAVTVDHQTPSFTTSDLYDELADLDVLIHEYYEAYIQDPKRAETVKEQIAKMAKDLNFDDISIEGISDSLFEMKRSIIPRGLHIFGKNYKNNEIIDLLTLVSRYDREVPSLHRIIAESKGLDYEKLLSHPSRSTNGGVSWEQIESEAREIIILLLNGSSDQRLLDNFSIKFQQKAVSIFDYLRNLYAKIENNHEIEGLLNAISGKFIVPNIGGDPIRTPEIFPTGSNIYSFDPRLIPSSAACIRGEAIAEATINEFYKINGKYPEAVSVVLWGFETVKTRGETIGQILCYLGLRPVRKSGPWFTDLEVTGLDELKRPRIDVVVTICGIFRDTLPNLIILLGNAFKLAASLDESCEMNFVRKHSEEISGKLMDDDKIKTAQIRIFGPKTGEYATPLTTMIETSEWNNEEDLANAYINSMQYGYDDNTHGASSKKAFRQLLSNVDLVSQVRDTHELEITELDHYYEFYGGLSKSIESIKGKKPQMLIADTTREIIQVEDPEKSIERSVRTRLLNPKWIDAMLEHSFHGTQKISDKVENILGLAATTGKVREWVWRNISNRYIFDNEMKDRLVDNNSFAALKLLKKLIEADKREYWQTTNEESQKLMEAFLELEGVIEEKN